MRSSRYALWILAATLPLFVRPAMGDERPRQFILVNRIPGPLWNQNRPDSFRREGFEEIKRALPDVPGAQVRPGISFIFSYFNTAKDETLVDSLRRFLEVAAETDTPVVVQLDGENWWEARPDLWNWWDPALPGFNPANRENVEWFGWSPEQALKLAWRNWGRQLRVRPPPNLMSPRYRAACREKMALLVPVVLQWWKALPAEKRDLLVGVKLGHETSIGVNAWYYPDGNTLLDQPTEDDPKSGLKANELPARGVTQTGYAAVKTAGIRSQGPLTEADLAEIARRHLEDLCRHAAELGVPRDRLFTHGVGWKEDELLYQAAVNAYSCPGWSFYRRAADPGKDAGVQRALKRSDAPFWAAVEWLYQGPRDESRWRKAIENTLADAQCRYLCVFNWEGICDNRAAVESIGKAIAASARPSPK